MGVPIAFTMVIAGLAAVLVQGSIDPMVAVQNMFAGIDSFPLLAIPFFILAAELMTAAHSPRSCSTSPAGSWDTLRRSRTPTSSH
jgi:hypothetical protein